MQCKWTRRFLLGLACTLTFSLLTAPAQAKKDNPDDAPEQGSTVEEIAALKARPLPLPNTLKVAILPFYDVTGSISHVRMGTVANYLLYQREGFQVLPVLEGFKAVEADKEVEAGLPLRRSDAVRLGKTMGADWAVYGEIRELRHYTKSSVFKEAKYLIAGIRIAVVNVNNGDSIYWNHRSDKTGGTGAGTNRRAATLKRRGVIIASSNALKPLFEAFPAHEVKGESPDSGELATLVNQLWPGDKRND